MKLASVAKWLLELQITFPLKLWVGVSSGTLDCFLLGRCQDSLQKISGSMQVTEITHKGTHEFFIHQLSCNVHMTFTVSVSLKHQTRCTKCWIDFSTFMKGFCHNICNFWNYIVSISQLAINFQMSLCFLLDRCLMMGCFKMYIGMPYCGQWTSLYYL
jgi:hypothetical protein